MRCIALTGGIATGKSTVAALLIERGAVLVDADQIARQVVEPGESALAEIRAAFGDRVMAADGTLDRAALGRLVFADPAQRLRLEAITHPRIRTAMADEILTAMAGPASLTVVDIPLLYESGRDADFPEVLLVYADQATQRARLRRRDGLDDPSVVDRLSAQLPIDEKRARAKWIIDNSGALEHTERQVADWWRRVVGS